MNLQRQLDDEGRGCRLTCCGFTLLELLVVVGIIGILAALLLPSLRKAKARGNGVLCINNLKQLQVAWQLYVGDHNDVPPINGHMNWAGKMNPHNWVAGVMAYEPFQNATNQYHINLTESTNVILMMDKSRSSLAEYLKTPRVLKCPGDRSWIILGDHKHDRVRSYANFNDRVLGSGQRKGTRPVFVEEHEDSINDGYFEGPQVDAQNLWNSVPSARHESRGGISFVDGHVELHKWNDPRTMIPIKRLMYLTGVSSTNNSDLLWFHEREK